MRRFTTAFAVALAVFMMGGIGWAGENHIDAPARVDAGDRLKVRILDCRSGETWNAVVLLRIEDVRDGEVVDRALVDADDSGTTILKFRIVGAEYSGTRYRIFARCIHEFNDGSEGVFWRDTVVFRVND